MLSLDSIPEITSCRQIRAYEKVTEKIECFSDYTNIRELFKHFFRCSTLNMWDCFDFDRAFKVTMPYIRYKLDEHGQRSFGDYLAFQRVDIDSLTQDKRSWHDANYEFEHISFGALPQFQNLISIECGYTNANWVYTTSNAVSLFDVIIHAEHMSGDIFEWELIPDDPNSLRVKVDKELLF